MRRTLKNLTIGLVLGFSAIATLYELFQVYLLADWPVDDSRAAQMDTFDWLIAAGGRIAFFTLEGLALAAIIYVSIRLALGWRTVGKESVWTKRLAFICVGLIGLTALLKGLYFFYTKPSF